MPDEISEWYHADCEDLDVPPKGLRAACEEIYRLGFVRGREISDDEWKTSLDKKPPHIMEIVQQDGGYVACCRCKWESSPAVTVLKALAEFRHHKGEYSHA